MSQKSASLLANDMLARGLVPDSRARLDALRPMPGLSQWWRQPMRSAALLVLGDSTGWDPGTTNGSAIGGAAGGGGYSRWVASLAAKAAASTADVNVVFWENDFTNGNLKYQAPRVLKTGSGGLLRATLPGANNAVLYLAKNNANRVTGVRHFFAAKVKATVWKPTAYQTILSDWGDPGQLSWSMGIFTDGTLGFSWTQDGTASFNRFSSVAVPGVVDATTVLWVGVDVQWDNGAGAATFTFMTSTDGDTWTTLGTPVVYTGPAGALTPFQTTTPYQIGGRVLGGAASTNFAGDVYEVQLRSGGVAGPTILPTQVDSWKQHPGTPNVDTPFHPFFGSPTLHVVNASWPGQGLDQFDDPTNLPLLVPHFPYLGAILNTGHNDQTYNTARSLADKWDRLLARVDDRAPDAEVAVLTQNPTLRTDGPTGNPNAVRYEHTARMARLAGYARHRGLGVIDTFQTFSDWTGGAGLTDLLDPAGGPTQIVHPYGPGVTRQTQKVWDEVFSA